MPFMAAQLLLKRWVRSPRFWLIIGLGIDITLLAATLCYQFAGHPEVNPAVNFLTVMSGVILTSLIALSTVDHLNRQNQRRQWQRDDTLGAFSPVLAEMDDNIVKLSKLQPVSTQRGRAVAKDLRRAALAAPLGNKLASFYRELIEYEEHDYPAAVEHGRAIAERRVLFLFKMRGYGASYQDYGGMGAAIHRDLTKVIDGDLQNLLPPDTMAAFRKSYDATVDEVMKVESAASYQIPGVGPAPRGAPFPSAEDAVKLIKQEVAAEKETQGLRAGQDSLRVKAERISEELRAELQKFYGPPLP